MAMQQSFQPFDLEAQSQEITRQRALAEALQQRALAPKQGQMISGRYVAPGIGSAIESIGNALLSRLNRQSADAGQKAYGEQYGQQLSAGLKSYLDTRNGAPGGTLSTKQAGNLLNNDQAPPQDALHEPVQADPRAAIVGAMTSRLPELQKIGQMDFANINKKPEWKEHVLPDGTLVRTNPDSTEVRNLGNFSKLLEKWSDPYDIPGEKGKFRKNLSTGKVEGIGQAGTTVNVNTNDTAAEAFAKKLGEQKAKALQESFTTAQAASKGLDAMGSARQDLEAGVKTGASAEINLALSKWGRALGVGGSDDPKIANTEAYRATMARETLQLVKGLGSGTGISNADREFAEKASGGLITLDDHTMLRLMDVATAAAGNVLMGHDKMVGHLAASNGGNEADLAAFRLPISFHAGEGVAWDKDTGRFTTKAPANSAPKGTAANPMTFEEWQATQQGKGR